MKPYNPAVGIEASQFCQTCLSYAINAFLQIESGLPPFGKQEVRCPKCHHGIMSGNKCPTCGWEELSGGNLVKP